MNAFGDVEGLPYLVMEYVEGTTVKEEMGRRQIRLQEDRVFFFALPLRIEGLDACWIRPIAVEPIDVGTRLAEIFLGMETLWES